MNNKILQSTFFAFSLLLISAASASPWDDVPELAPVDVLCPRGELVGVTADGKAYLTAGRAWAIRWRVADSEPFEKHFLGADCSLVRGMSADGSRLVALSSAGVFVYDTQERSRVVDLPSSGDIWAADVSPDGKLVAIAPRETNVKPTVNRIEIWDIERRARRSSVALEPALDDVQWMKFSRDGARVLVAARKPKCMLIDANGGTLLKALNVQAYVTCSRGLSMGRNYGWIGNYEEIRIVDMTTGEFVGEALRGEGRNRFEAVQISDDDKSVLVVRQNGWISRMSLPALRETERYLPRGLDVTERLVAFSPGGDLALVPCHLNHDKAALHVVEFPSGRLVSSRSMRPPLLSRLGFTHALKSVSPGGGYVTGVPGYQAPVCVWRASTWQMTGAARTHDDMLAVSADGLCLASAFGGRLFFPKLIEPEELKRRHTGWNHTPAIEVDLKQHLGGPDKVTAISFSGGYILATGHESGRIITWDARNGAYLKRLGKHGGAQETEWIDVDLGGPDAPSALMAAGTVTVRSVLSLCGSSDGRHLFSNGKDGELICWDLEKGGKVWASGVGQAVWLVASPDDRLLAAAVLGPEIPSQPAREQLGVVLIDSKSGETLARIPRLGNTTFKQGAFLSPARLVLDVGDALFVYKVPGREQ